MPSYSAITPEILRDIKEAVGPDAVVLHPEKLCEFGKDAGEEERLPELVVEATSTQQVSALLRLANRHSFPVTPRGLGTGLAGGSVPLFGGVLLSLAKMNRILAIEKDNLIAVVEPGVVTLDLQNAVKKEGLFYPPDPASLDTCSIGGNAATNAGGPSCVKYGTTRDYILGLEAVLPSGDIIKAGVRTRKGVVGYDLRHLLLGSEGTLGVITKLILKLIPYPATITTMVAFFPRLTSAMSAVTATLTRGHVPCAVELLDDRCLEITGDLLPFDEARSAQAMLIIETDGIQEVIEREMEAIGGICLEEGADQVVMAPDSQKRARIWEIRRAVSLRIEERFPLYLHEDIVVPIGKIAKLVGGLRELEEMYGMRIYSFGHAGDGNIHVNITAEDPKCRDRIEEGIEDLLRTVLSMGGTISGEHGIGITKKPFLPMELSAESIRIQKEIKRIFDPQQILNPGKIFQGDL
ncbi:MAG TPA: FAD-linked oxidase C-terminal domain-containing protein [Syntrophales bacterium]|nr:FAD-linked oxidase C-terminal domain-containing protein [Syntrophales bacterium]